MRNRFNKHLKKCINEFYLKFYREKKYNRIQKDINNYNEIFVKIKILVKLKIKICSTSSLSSSCFPLFLLLVLTCCFLFCLKELLHLVLVFFFMLLRLLPCSRFKFLRWWRTVVRVFDLGLLVEPLLIDDLDRYLPVLRSLFSLDIDLPELGACITPVFFDND